MTSSLVLSVLIPVYNVERYLRQCLAVVSQTFRDIEVICVNDGSTDSSFQILQEYAAKDNRFTVINQLNSGALLARKRAVLAANGKYSIFLDSDDWLAEADAIQTMVGMAEREQVDMLHFSVSISGDAGTEVERYKKAYSNRPKVFKDQKNLVRFIFKSHLWTLWTKIYKSSCLKQAFGEMPDLRISMSEDAYSFLFIAWCSKSYKSIVTKPLLMYRLGTGISTTVELSLNGFRRYVEPFEMIASLRDFFTKKNTLDEYRYLVDYLYARICTDAAHALGKVATDDLSKAAEWLGQHLVLSDLVKEYSVFKHIKYSLLSSVMSGDAKARYERKAAKRFANLKYLRKMI